jgi:hypothetical protein
VTAGDGAAASRGARSVCWVTGVGWGMGNSAGVTQRF